MRIEYLTTKQGTGAISVPIRPSVGLNSNIFHVKFYMQVQPCCFNYIAGPVQRICGWTWRCLWASGFRANDGSRRIPGGASQGSYQGKTCKDWSFTAHIFFGSISICVYREEKFQFALATVDHFCIFYQRDMLFLNISQPKAFELIVSL